MEISRKIRPEAGRGAGRRRILDPRDHSACSLFLFFLSFVSITFLCLNVIRANWPPLSPSGDLQAKVKRHLSDVSVLL